MKIKVNKDLDKYDTGVWKGLSGRELIYIGISVGVGAVIILSLKSVLSLTAATYVAIPFVIPISYCGFYSKNGMTLIQVLRRKWKLLWQRPLTYVSTENRDNLDKWIRQKELNKRKGKGVRK